MKKQRQIKKAKDKQSLFPLIRLHLVSMIMLLFLFLFIYNKPTSSFSSIRSLLTSDKINKPLSLAEIFHYEDECYETSKKAII